MDLSQISHPRLERNPDGDQCGRSSRRSRLAPSGYHRILRRVEVRLQNHAAKGITDKDFELAKKIEDVVHWQPGKDGGALEGTPEQDQRFAYIKYDL